MVVANTGWGWEQTERELDLHRLPALTREWQRNPPVHHLVAAYLGYEFKEDDDDPTDAPSDGAKPRWLSGMPAIPASDALKAAENEADALAALERQYFGEVKNVE